MLPTLRKYNPANDPTRIQLSGPFNIGALCFTLFLAASIIIIILNGDNSILALTRGTQYDDLMISNMTISSNNNQTDQMGIAGATGTEERSQGAMGEFIYGDYGNDEVQGSNGSDHLSGGPGNDVIYGYDGGDYIEGGPGIDSLYGGAGNDVLSGGEGADYFDCGSGRDSVVDFNSTEGDFALSNCEVLENEEAPAQ
jgi:Ca2+-binding RTX toxin-like protein